MPWAILCSKYFISSTHNVWIRRWDDAGIGFEMSERKWKRMCKNMHACHFCSGMLQIISTHRKTSFTLEFETPWIASMNKVMVKCYVVYLSIYSYLPICFILLISFNYQWHLYHDKWIKKPLILFLGISFIIFGNMVEVCFYIFEMKYRKI